MRENSGEAKKARLRIDVRRLDRRDLVPAKGLRIMSNPLDSEA
jgi:hypothetical protein